MLDVLSPQRTRREELLKTGALGLGSQLYKTSQGT